MAKQEFLESISSLAVTNRSELFSLVDIHDKITFMSEPIPEEHSSKLHWQKLHARFKILPYQSWKVERVIEEIKILTTLVHGVEQHQD